MSLRELSEKEPGFELRFHHCAISVPDLEESIAWYVGMLGFEVEQRQYIKAIPARIAFVRGGNCRIEIFEVDGASPLPAGRSDPLLDVRTHGVKHVCFAVDDPPAVIAELRNKGADVVFEDVIDGTPMGFVRDNVGNLVEFLQAPGTRSS